METRETILEKAMELSDEDKELLIIYLMSSFESRTQEEINISWAMEAEDRLKAYKEGKLSSITLEESKRRITSR